MLSSSDGPPLSGERLAKELAVARPMAESSGIAKVASASAAGVPGRGSQSETRRVGSLDASGRGENRESKRLARGGRLGT